MPRVGGLPDDIGDGFTIGVRREQSIWVAQRNAGRGVAVLEGLDQVSWPAGEVDALVARVHELAAVYGPADTPATRPDTTRLAGGS